MRQSPRVSLQITVLFWLLGLAPAQAQVGDAVFQSGVPVKLITIRPTKIFAEPDTNSASAPIELFQVWYVLPPDPLLTTRERSELPSLTRDGFYRVAASVQASAEQGWLAEEDAMVWAHRQAVRTIGRRNGQPVRFYPSRTQAIEALETGDTSAATHQEPPSSLSSQLLLPILESEEIDFDGESTNLYKVAFVSGAAAPQGQKAPTRPSPTQEEALQLSTLDLVFVIDTTPSMVNPIDQVRRSVARVVRNLASQPLLKPRLRFGLVGYRDTEDGKNPGDMEYVARVFCTLAEGANHRKFLNRLANLETTIHPSAEYPEDVLAGLSRAMDTGMGWNRFAWKQIVVVGDSSAKVPGHPDVETPNEEGRTLASIVERAQNTGGEGAPFVLSVVRVKDPTFSDDHIIGDKQYNQLVAGEGYNGYLISTRGGADAEDFSAELTQRLEQGLESFKNVLAHGGVTGPVSAGLSSAEYPYPLLDLIRALPDEQASNAGDHRFATRYCTDLDPDGNRSLVPHVLVRQGQLRLFVSFVDFLLAAFDEAGEFGSKDIETVVSQLKSLTLSLNIGEPLKAETPISTVLEALLELPVKTPIFSYTVAQLAAMDAIEWQAFVQSVDLSSGVLRDLLDNSNLWFELHPNSQDRHAYVALSDLP